MSACTGWVVVAQTFGSRHQLFSCWVLVSIGGTYVGSKPHVIDQVPACYYINLGGVN